jgi:glycosyltransferase involved in cell wall biosynthesis
MKIAVWHNLPSGGGKRQLYYHVKGLVERGHYVESWCPDTANQNFLPLGNIIKENIIPLEISSNKGIAYDILKNSDDVKYIINIMDRHCQKCAEQINQRDFDILYANSCTFLRTSAISKYIKLPSAIYLNEAYRWFYEALPELPWIAPSDLIHRKESLINAIKHYLQKKNKPLDGLRIQARQELEYARTFDEILSNSIFSRESILKAYNLESKVCYLGVDTGFYKPTGEKKEKFVVGLGTIYHAKGIDRAIKAMAAIKAQQRPALTWIGNGAWENDLKSYQRLAQELNVNFTPKINIRDSEVISLLSRASVMIYTSRLEPFGLAPLEANACETAVVGIAEGGVKETVKNGVNGCLVNEDNSEQLAELLLQFVSNSKMAVEWGKQSRKYVEENWNLELCTANIENCLIQLESSGKTYHKKVIKSIDTTFPEPINPIKTGIDKLDYRSDGLHIRGWAFIDDGKSANDSRIYIIIKDSSPVKIIEAKKCKRPDVTAAHGNRIDYDDSGFYLEEKIKLKKPFQMGILVIRKQDTAVQIFRE